MYLKSIITTEKYEKVKQQNISFFSDFLFWSIPQISIQFPSSIELYFPSFANFQDDSTEYIMWHMFAKRNRIKNDGIWNFHLWTSLHCVRIILFPLFYHFSHLYDCELRDIGKHNSWIKSKNKKTNLKNK